MLSARNGPAPARRSAVRWSHLDGPWSVADGRRRNEVDLLDRVLATGVVVTGDITLAIADVDLVRISLRALIASVGALGPPESDPSAAKAAP
ncbi:gas vesicle protein [Micromonospora sp. NPDC093277]|uniref:gas vesicle protein n=1 Tax=Micromonospora sp. NPDC093277 TaxID=3364291 RepID=UPI00381B8E48